MRYRPELINAKESLKKKPPLLLLILFAPNQVVLDLDNPLSYTNAWPPWTTVLLHKAFPSKSPENESNKNIKRGIFHNADRDRKIARNA